MKSSTPLSLSLSLSLSVSLCLNRLTMTTKNNGKINASFKKQNIYLNHRLREDAIVESLAPDLIRSSRYGGFPYLPRGETWPDAGRHLCKSSSLSDSCSISPLYLPFILQLRLADLPDHMGKAYALPHLPLSTQLLQVFFGETKLPSGYNRYNGFARIFDCTPDAETNLVFPFPIDKNHGNLHVNSSSFTT